MLHFLLLPPPHRVPPYAAMSAFFSAGSVTRRLTSLPPCGRILPSAPYCRPSPADAAKPREKDAPDASIWVARGAAPAPSTAVLTRAATASPLTRHPPTAELAKRMSPRRISLGEC